MKEIRTIIIAVVCFVVTGLVETGRAQTSASFNGIGTYVVPPGVTLVTVELWGAGGAGGGNGNTEGCGGGGGGGSYIKYENVAVVPGAYYDIVAGLGGVPGVNGGNGGTTYAYFPVTYTANGGNGGTWSANGIGGAGGTGGTYDGGTGANGSSGLYGGGGGSSAGKTQNGNNGNANFGGSAPMGGGAGGNGGVIISSSYANGSNGLAPGGGGGGGISTSSSSPAYGGNGANGRVTITWICPTIGSLQYGEFLPTSGCAGSGTSVAIFGSSFTGAIGVSFNGTPAVFTVMQYNIIATNLPAGATTGPITVSLSGCSATSTNNFTVYPTPSPTLTGPLAVCQGADNVYTTQSGMVNYVWEVSDGGSITSWGSTSDHTATVQWSVPGPHYVRVNYANSNGCQSGTPAQVDVTVTSSPYYTTDLDKIICNGSITGIVLPTTDDYGYPVTSYTITSAVGSGISGTAFSGTTSDPDAIKNDQFTNSTGNPAIVTYNITPFNSTCQGETFTITVTVEPTAQATPNIPSQAVCNNNPPTITVNVTTINGNNYLVSAVSTTNVTGYSVPPYTRPDGATIDPNNLVNPTGSSQSIIYTIVPYTYGTNGLDDSGTGDDCPGTPFEVTVVVRPQATISVNNLTVPESVGNAVMTFTLPQPLPCVVEFNISTADSTAVAGQDYTALTNYHVSIPANSLSASASIPITEDNVVEPSEVFKVYFSSAVNVTLPSMRTVTISDNDEATLFVNSPDPVVEGDAVTFVVTLSGMVQGGFSVAYTTSDGTALQPGDYTTASGTLAFTGNTSVETHMFSVTTIDDAMVELTETFTASLGAITGLAGGNLYIVSPDGTGTILDNDEATISINDVSVNEAAGTAIFTVTVNNSLQNNITLDYATADNTALQPGDYTSTSGTITFGGTSPSSQTITVPIVEDFLVEGAEQYFVNLSNLNANGQNVTIADAQGIGTITDNDNASLSVNDITVSENVGIATVSVTLSGTVQNNFTLDFATADNSAVQPGDYTPASGSLTFGGLNPQVQQINVLITDDLLVETSENFRVNLSNLITYGQAVSISDNQGIVTITDNDNASITVNDITVDESAGAAVFTVTLVNAVQNSFTLSFATADNTAVQPGDFTTTSGSLTFGANQPMSQTVSVPVINDLVIEIAETFFLDLSNLITNGQNVTIADAQGICTITDNDQAMLSVDDVTVSESAGNALFTVSLSVPVQNTFTVDFLTADNTAVQPGDYTQTGGTLTFGGANPLTQQISVPVTDDLITEYTEHFLLNLGNLVTYGLNITIADAQGVGTITDNDQALLSIGDVIVNEADGVALLEVTLSNATQYEITVDYASADQTALQPGDYTFSSGTLTFGGVNPLNQYISVPVIDDFLTESSEQFLVNLSNLYANGQNVSIGDAQGVVTITDNDNATLSVNDVTVNESAGNAVFSVNLNNAVQNAFTLEFSTADNTAVHPDDYTLSTGILTFGGGNPMVQTISVPIIDDPLTENSETYFVNLFNLLANGQGVSLADAQGLGTITDNEGVTLSINDVTVNEAAGSAVFTVTLNSAVQNDFTVDFATEDHTALQPGDYTLTTGTLTFGGAHPLTQTVSVPVINDLLTEVTEDFYVNLVNLVTNGQNIVIADGQGKGTITDNDIAVLTVNDISVGEAAGTAVFTVSLSNSVQNNFTISYSTANNTAVQPGDYTLSIGTLTFGGINPLTQTIPVPVINDLLIENTESFYLNLINLVPNGQNVSIADAQGLGTITDNDNATLVIGDVSVNEAAGSASFAVTLSAAVQNTFTLSYATADHTAVQPGDYTSTGGILTFGGVNPLTQYISVPIINDLLTENTEDFYANLSNLVTNGQGISISDAQGVGTITDNDQASLSVNDVTVNEAAGTAVFAVTLGSAVQNTFSVSYTTADNTAVQPGDYFPASGTLNFGGGNPMAQTIMVGIVNDLFTEGPETYFLNLFNLNTNGQNITLSDAQGLGTITDDDNATLSVDDVSVNEDAGFAVFTVTLSGTVQNDFTVDYTTADNTAVAPGDYTLTKGTLTFGGIHPAAQQLSVPIIDDLLTEATETYYMNLLSIIANGQNVTFSDAQGLGTITDNDNASISVTDVTVLESAGMAVFTISLTGAVQNTFSLSYATANNTAQQPGDYTHTTGTLTFGGASPLIQTVSVPVINDLLVETTETFFLNLSNLVTNGQNVSLSDAQGLGTITDNDNAMLTVNDVSVAESAGTAVFTVTLSNMVQSVFTLEALTADNTAVQPGDYTQAGGTLSFGGANPLTQSLSVPIINDLTVEATETFFANLFNLNANGQAITIADAQGLGTITDNDNAALSVNDITVDEAAGTAVFTVTLSNPVQNGFTVGYGTADNTAVQSMDYTSSSGSLSFGGLNPLTQNIMVTIIDDLISEATETYFLNLSNLITNGQNVSIGDAQGTGTITDNDAASLSVSDVTVNEDAGTAVFTVTLSNPVQQAITVNYASADNTAAQPGDYTQVQGILSLGGANPLTLTISVPVINDLITEPAETFFLNLGNLVTNGQNVSIADPQGTGTITDNDNASISVSDVTVSEDAGMAIFTVSLSNSVQQPFTFDYATADQTAFQPGDYSPGTGTLTFGGGNPQIQTISITVTDDLVAETTEQFLLNLQNLVTNGQNVSFADAQGIGTITDNDIASITITDVTVSEAAGTAVFTVSLDYPVQNAVTLTYSTADNTALQPGDYTQAGGSLSLGGANPMTQQISVAIINDLVPETTETFFMNLGNLIAGGQNAVIADAQGICSITDDDETNLVISDVTVSEGGGNAVFTVTLSSPVQNDFTVGFTTSDNTAVQPGDYSLSAGTLTFGGANPMVQQISVPVVDDMLVEGTETFFVDLVNLVTNGQNVTLADAQGLGTITDNDNASIIVNDITVNENAGTATFTVMMSNNTQQGVSLSFATADNTALQTVDYALSTGILTFGGVNPLSHIVSISIINDLLAEPVENFFLNLSNLITNGQNVTIADGQGICTINDNDNATIAINDIVTSEASGIASFTVTLSSPVQNSFSFNFSTSDNTAVQPGDYTLTTGTLTLGGANPLSQTVTVTIINDLLAEPTESFFVNLGNLAAGGQNVSFSDSQGSCTIDDNDNATLSVNDLTVNENAGIATFTVTLSAAVQNNFTLEYTSADNTAIQAGDYTATAGTLTFGSANPASKTVSVPIVNDLLVENAESFYLNLFNLVTNGQPVSISDMQGVCIITDNDNATVSINDVTVNESAGTAVLTVTLSNLVQDDFTLDFATAANTAVQPDDFTQSAGMLTFGGAHPLTQQLSVPIVDNIIAEATEDFFVNLSNLIISGQNINITDAQGICTITDNDNATISIDDISVNEDAGTAVFTVTLSNPVQQDITLQYATADGSAVQPGDYTQETGTLTFDGSLPLTRQLSIPITNDLITEGTEVFTVNLSNLNAYGQNVSISDAQGSCTINDNDQSSITVSDVTVGENAGTAVFTVTLNNTVQNAFTLNFATADHSAIQPGDYTLSSGSLSFGGANPATQSITVPVNNDLVAEGTEDFYLNLSNLVTNGQNITITDAQGIGTITDDDNATITVNDVSVSENAGTAVFTVTLSNAVQDVVTLNFATLDNSAVQPGDYSLVSGMLTFGGANPLTQTVSIAIINDMVTEPVEQFFINLDNLAPNGQNVTIGDAQGICTITDNDFTTISLSDITVDEDDGTAVFTVSLNSAVQNVFTLGYGTADHTAVQPGDYTLTSGTLSFGGANPMSQIVSVPIIDDMLSENSEDFYLNLGSLVTNGQNVVIAVTQGVCTITDNDNTYLSVNDISVDESAGMAVFTVTLNNPVTNDFTVDYSTSDFTAVQPGDYTQLIGTLTFGGLNPLVQTVSVPVINDLLTENTESFRINLVNLVTNGQSVALSDPQGVCTITDNDNSSISVGDITVDENAGTASFTVSLSSAVQNEFSFDYATADHTATQPSDYSSATGSLIFGGTHPLSQLVNISLVNDLIAEPSEDFYLNLFNLAPNGQNVTISDGQAVCLVQDDDLATVSINDVTVSEGGGSASFTLSLSNPVQSGITLDYATADFTAQQPGDYTPAAGSVTLGGAAPLLQTVTVPVIDDLLTENTEYFYLNLDNLQTNGQNISFADAQGIATITDNDNSVLTVSDVSVNEDAGTAVFTVTLSNAAQYDLNVDYATADNTAVNPGDYTQTAGTLTFGGVNPLVQTISVPVINDLLLENTEHFFLNLSNLAAGGQQVSIGDAQGTGTITDDDQAVISINDISVNEDAGNAVFTVSIDNPAQEIITLDFSTANNSAIQPDDYTTVAGTLVFGGVNPPSQTISVPIINDLLIEDIEDFFVNLGNLNAGGQNATISDGQGTGTIIDNDYGTITVNDVTVSESAGTAVFTVTLDQAAQNPVTLTFATADFSAVQPDDYTLTSGTLTFGGANPLAQNISVPVIDDPAPESTEQFILNLGNLVTNGQNISFANAQGTGTIIDNDFTDVAVIKSGDTITAAGQEIHYTLTIRNLGPSDAVDVILKDTLDLAILAPQYSVNNGLSWSGWTGTLSLGTMAYPTDTMRTVLLKGSVSISTCHSLANTAWVESATIDMDLSNNHSETIITAVPDLTPPGLQCPPTVVMQSGSACQITIDNIDPLNVNDNCGVPVVTYVATGASNFSGLGSASGLTFNNGVTTVTYTATDQAVPLPNTTSCSFDVIVLETDPPALTCPADISVQTSPSSCDAMIFDLGQPEFSDNCTDSALITITNDHPGQMFPVGTTIVSWTATDANGNSSVCTQQVTVTDLIAPSLSCVPLITGITNPNTCFATGIVLPLPVASDNCSVVSLSSNAPASFSAGSTVVTWVASDPYGNVGTCATTVIVYDQQLPSINCPANITQSDPYVTVPMPVVSDNCGIAILTNSFNGMPDASGIYPQGTTTVVYTVTDISGNTASCSFWVLISDSLTPSITGIMRYFNVAGSPLTNSQVLLKQGNTVLAISPTDGSGRFNFYAIPNGTYTLGASTTQPWGGGNATDALLILLHFVQMQPLTGLPLLAADVSADFFINSLDALFVAKRYVALISSFPSGDWIFTSPTVIHFNDPDTVDVFSLCYGDVNRSYTPLAKAPVSLVSMEQSGIQYYDEGQAWLPVRVRHPLKAGAVSLALEYPAESYEIIDVKVDGIGDANTVYSAAGGLLRIAWYSKDPLELRADDQLLRILVREKPNINTQERVWRLLAESEIAGTDAEPLPVALSMPRLAGSDDDPSVSVYPNPLDQYTIFTYTLAEETMVGLSLFDATGKLVFSLEPQRQNPGNNKIEVDASGLRPGFYTWRMTCCDTGLSANYGHLVISR